MRPRRTTKAARRPKGAGPIRTIAIVGSGLIGGSWAALFLAHGYDVVAWDPDGKAIATLRGRVSRARRQLDSLGIRNRARLRIAPVLAAAIGGADFIQECAPESLPIKHELIKAIEAEAKPSAIIASSTSAHPWSAIASQSSRPDRLIIAHPFNPPHLVPLVELYGTNPAMVERAARLYRGLGKVPVTLKREAPGHVANRLASALWREAVHIVAEGIADVADVDAALVEGPGLRWAVMGAHMTYHLGGGPGGIRAYLEHLGPSQERRWASLGSPKLTSEVAKRIVKGVRAEAKGRSIAELERERDRALMAILRVRRRKKLRD